MRNEVLERTVLRNLRLVDCGLSERALRAAVEVDMDRPDLTTADFEEVLRQLEDRGLVDVWQNLIGQKIWGITALGKDALKGL